MPIHLGDLIQYAGQRWLVYKIDPSTATAFIQSQDHERQILGTEADCTVVCNPLQDWPMMALPTSLSTHASFYSGKIEITNPVSRPSAPSPSSVVLLKWLYDWVRIDDFQICGALYFNPALQLRFKDRLILRAEDSTRFSINVPRKFQPFKVTKDAISKRESKRLATFDLYSCLVEKSS